MIARWFTQIGQTLAPTDTQGRNVRSVLIDGIGVGIVAGVVTFLAVFLTRLGASPLLVGLLTAMPAFTGMLLAIPVSRFLERQRNVAPWYSRARVLVQGSYMLIGLTPFLVPLQYTPYAIIAIAALVTIPQTIVNITFTVVMGAVAGPRQRQYLMSRRWSVLGVATALTVAAVGWGLDRVGFPLNYQLIFIGSFFGGMLSFAFSSQISIPDNPPVPPEHIGQGQIAALREGIANLRANPPFANFVAATFVFNLGMMMALPLFPLYWVRVVHASDTWIGVITTVNNAVLLGAYFLWTTITRRRGNVLVLRVCAFGLGLYPLLTALTTQELPLPLFAALAGIFGAGLNLVLFDISLATVPPERVASFVAVYQLTTYAATLVAPLIGTTLAGAVGYAPALVLAATLRFAGAGLYVLLKVGEHSDQ